jgi:hypothetical protein
MVTAAATLVASVAAIAASITTIDPQPVSVGMPFVISGGGFGTAKPKVTLVAGKKKAALKVVAPFTDGAINATVTSAKYAGLYTLTVGKGATAVQSVLTVAAAAPATITPPNPAPGASFTIGGKYFGTKKSKVRVGTLVAKVTSWTDDTIVAVLSAKQPAGTQDVFVKNTVGESKAPTGADVGGAGVATVHQIGILNPSDPQRNQALGASIAIGPSFTVLGAPTRLGGTLGNNQQGAFYVYGTTPAGTHTEDAIVTRTNAKETAESFGYDVAVAAGTILVGAPGHKDGSTNYSGDVYSFKNTGTWGIDQELLPSDPVTGGNFGWSVAAQGNRCAVGAPNAKTNNVATGAVYVYARTSESAQWTLEQRIAPAPSDNAGLFGADVALDGDTLVIGGAIVGGTGTANSAQVWVRNPANSTWSKQQALTLTGAAGNEAFGSSVAIAGDSVVVGAAGEATGRGGAYVFHRAGTAWTQQGHLVPSGAAQGDQVGTAVAISGDAAVAGPALGSARAYVFHRTGSAWAAAAILTPDDGETTGLFGSALAIDATRILVGAHGASDGLGGRTYVFQNN